MIYRKATSSMWYSLIFLVVLLIFFFVGTRIYSMIKVGDTGIKEISGVSPQETMRDADYAFNNSAYDEAIRIYRDFLEKFPENRNAFIAQYQIGEAYFAMDNFKMALAAYQATLDNYKLDSDWSSKINQKIAECNSRILNPS